MAQRTARVQRKVEDVEYDQKLHVSLASTAKMFERSENYCWYDLADAFKLKRYTNDNGLCFFNREAVKKAKARFDKMMTGTGARLPRGVIQKMIDANTHTIRKPVLHNKPIIDDGVPVVEIDADMFAALVKKGAIKVRMKS